MNRPFFKEFAHEIGSAFGYVLDVFASREAGIIDGRRGIRKDFSLGNTHFGVGRGFASYVREKKPSVGFGMNEDLGAEVEDFFTFGI